MIDARMEWAAFELMDGLRRSQGAALDALGLGPIETPYETVLSEPGVRLRRYGSGGGDNGPTVLLVPAPVKRPYIWDLAPDVSVIRHCLRAGLRPFLLEWQSTDRDFGLAQYAGRLILDCIEAMGSRDAVLVAHSLGGLFAAIFAALHPDRVRGLVLLAAPLHFAQNVGIFGAMVEDVRPDDLPASIPGSFLSAASFRASPGTFGWDRWADFLSSLPQPGALGTHLRVERWTMDEFPLPRRLFAELAQRIAREDAFIRGLLEIDGRSARPSQVTAPLVCVLDTRCRVVPPDAILPFYQAAGSKDKTLLSYDGDVGVSLQHVGVLVGRNAHARLWPEIVRWIGARSAGGEQDAYAATHGGRAA
jgi:polyhydroxyalkanoate synthase